jgi:hypothetical protein
VGTEQDPDSHPVFIEYRIKTPQTFWLLSYREGEGPRLTDCTHTWQEQDPPDSLKVSYGTGQDTPDSATVLKWEKNRTCQIHWPFSYRPRAGPNSLTDLIWGKKGAGPTRLSECRHTGQKRNPLDSPTVLTGGWNCRKSEPNGKSDISRDLPWQKRCCYQKPSVLICGLSSLRLVTDKMFPDHFITDSYLSNMQSNRPLNEKVYL